MDKSVLTMFLELTDIQKRNNNIQYYTNKLIELYNKKNELDRNFMKCEKFNNIKKMINDLIYKISMISIEDIMNENHDTTNIKTLINNINDKYVDIQKTFISKK